MSEYKGDVRAPNDIGNLEVYECECGFLLGVDTSYLEQVEPLIKIECPACQEFIVCGSVGEEEVFNGT